MDLNQRNLTPNSFLRTVVIIYFALLISMVLFGLVAIFSTSPWEIGMPPSGEVFLYFVPIFTFLGVLFGRVIYKRKLDSLINENSLKNKLVGLQSALIIKFAFVEAPYLLGIVSTILTGNIFYLMISGTLVMYFITLKPTKSLIIKHLDLNNQMTLQFERDNEVLT